ncbi:hypothetical protein EDEG_01675 [Edhazardia aedis USNM 41457]|uniref:Uncharacterized protein n=1 Tax=Edhazardia aedis (strain USNM 41457) TaxID=1003232 RepID=J9D8G2_EDHAE|nr:hypothetical protein EDEG_01675 [Edhazardia aedis USNM 41457]|eukprot:EJW04041.1 hypothetical protein EDEG_01675 [Edhazardia aedis USNM 41457]
MYTFFYCHKHITFFYITNLKNLENRHRKPFKASFILLLNLIIQIKKQKSRDLQVLSLVLQTSENSALLYWYLIYRREFLRKYIVKNALTVPFFLIQITLHLLIIKMLIRFDYLAQKMLRFGHMIYSLFLFQNDILGCNLIAHK